MAHHGFARLHANNTFFSALCLLHGFATGAGVTCLVSMRFCKHWRTLPCSRKRVYRSHSEALCCFFLPLRCSGEEGQWQRAYAEFYSAFTHYQEIGNRDRAKQCLKYVVVANMLSGGEQNPFDAREAKVYQNDADIAAIVGLRAAYEKCDVNAFNAALTEIVSTVNCGLRSSHAFTWSCVLMWSVGAVLCCCDWLPNRTTLLTASSPLISTA